MPSFFKRLFFREQFYVHNKIQRKMQRFPIFSLPSNVHTSIPIINIPHQTGTFVASDEPTLIYIIITQRPQLILEFILFQGVVHFFFLSFDICMIASIHHYGTILSMFLHKISSALCLYIPAPEPIPLQLTLLYLQFCLYQRITELNSFHINPLQISLFHLVL